MDMIVTTLPRWGRGVIAETTTGGLQRGRHTTGWGLSEG